MTPPLQFHRPSQGELRPLAEVTIPIPAATLADALTALHAAVDWFDATAGCLHHQEVRDLAAAAQCALVRALGGE